MSLISIAALLITMFVLSIAPGPSDFAVVARSMTAGFRQAGVMVAGIVAADFVFIVAAIYSMSEVAESMSGVFTAVKYACGAYLIWLGIGTLRARSDAANVRPEEAQRAGYSSFLGGFLITLGDPKAIVFYMGLFPAYVDLAKITLVETAIIMLIATAVICGVKLTYAWLADRAKQMFESQRFRRGMNIAAGVVLLATGMWLIVKG